MPRFTYTVPRSGDEAPYRALRSDGIFVTLEDSDFVAWNKAQPAPDDLKPRPPAAMTIARQRISALLAQSRGTWTAADCEDVLRAILSRLT